MTSTLRCGAMGRFWPYRTGAMQDAANELRRITLLRGWVNKGKKAGRDLSRIGPYPPRTHAPCPAPFFLHLPKERGTPQPRRGARRIRASFCGRASPTLRGSRREPRVGGLGDPADLLELSAGVQPGPFDVQRPHQAVAARVGRVPVRVELPPEGVGGYALPPLALAKGIEDRIALLVDIPGAPRPATVSFLISDRVEVPADHQLTVHERHHLRRAGGVAHPVAGAASSLVVLGHKVAAPGPEVELPIVLNHRFAEPANAGLGPPGGVVVSVGVELDQRLGGVGVHRVADARRPDRPAVELEVAVGRLAVVGAQRGVYAGLRLAPELLAGGEVERREAPPPAIDPP